MLIEAITEKISEGGSRSLLVSEVREEFADEIEVAGHACTEKFLRSNSAHFLVEMVDGLLRVRAAGVYSGGVPDWGTAKKARSAGCELLKYRAMVKAFLCKA